MWTYIMRCICSSTDRFPIFMYITGLSVRWNSVLHCCQLPPILSHWHWSDSTLCLSSTICSVCVDSKEEASEYNRYVIIVISHYYILLRSHHTAVQTIGFLYNMTDYSIVLLCTRIVVSRKGLNHYNMQLIVSVHHAHFEGVEFVPLH